MVEERFEERSEVTTAEPEMFLRCPRCQAEGGVVNVEARARVKIRVVDEGAAALTMVAGYEWDGESRAQCEPCGFIGRAFLFQQPQPRTAWLFSQDELAVFEAPILEYLSSPMGAVLTVDLRAQGGEQPCPVPVDAMQMHETAKPACDEAFAAIQLLHDRNQRDQEKMIEANGRIAKVMDRKRRPPGAATSDGARSPERREP